jgi:hypothetical protein
MRKRNILYCIVLLISILGFCSGCIFSTKNNVEPENIIKSNPEADIIIYQGNAWMKAAEDSWIMDLKLTPDKQIGVINKSGVINDLQDWNATILPEGTLVYKCIERNDMFLVKIGEEYIPYYLLVGE